MFDINDTTLIKKEILEILDNNDSFVSTSKLSKMIDLKSHATIRKFCSELKDYIADNYSKEEVEFITNKHYGNKLILHNVNIRHITSNLFSKDLNYEILINLLHYRVMDSYKFCSEHFISESQLRRKVRDINKYLNPLDIHISVSNKIKLLGHEHSIIAFHSVTLFYFYTCLTKIHFIDNHKEYLETTKDILRYLGIKYNRGTLKLATILFFTISNSNVELDEEFISYYLDGINVLEKPDFIELLSDEHWKFLNLTLFVSDLYDFDINADMEYREKIIPKKDIELWLSSFEKFFRKLTDEEKKTLDNKLFVKFLSHETLLTDDSIIALFNTLDFKKIKTQYPLYMQRFNLFWNDYISKSTQSHNFLKIESFLLCILFVNFDDMLPSVKLYLDTNMPSLVANYLKVAIKSQFLNRYHIQFTNEVEDTDLIIETTGNFVENANKKVHVVIDRKISDNNYTKISDAIEKNYYLKTKKNYEIECI